jgi:hypothetical protein
MEENSKFHVTCGWVSHGMDELAIKDNIAVMLRTIEAKRARGENVSVERLLKVEVLRQWKHTDFTFSTWVLDKFMNTMPKQLVDKIREAQETLWWSRGDTLREIVGGEDYIRNVANSDTYAAIKDYNFARGFVGTFCHGEDALTGIAIRCSIVDDAFGMDQMALCCMQMGRAYGGNACAAEGLM